MPPSRQELTVLRDPARDDSACGECATHAPLADAHSPSERSDDGNGHSDGTSHAVHRRFDRAARLLGEPAMARLARARVHVFGAGGVGSFCAEGLVRSGVATLRLVDFDRVCVTNVNRQLHALKGTLGKSKVAVMAERLRLVNPDATVEPVEEFYEARTAERLLAPTPDLVVDAIDNMAAKIHLITTCIERRIPLVSSMGAAARLDPTKVRIAPLFGTRNDPFAAELRKHLRRKHGFGAEETKGVIAVYSEERPSAPHELAYDHGGFRCVCPHGQNEHHTCDHRNRIEGSIGTVTSVFGMVCAQAAIDALTGRSGAAQRRENATA